MSILQKKAVRIVAAENYNAHTQPIFKSQKILPFDKFIEEVFTQKARQTVQSSFLSGGQDRMPHWECLVCMCGYCVHIAVVHFPLLLLGGGGEGDVLC